MGKDEDFSEFVAARWPRLVRSAVLLGCSQPEAEDVVQTALERCLQKWSRVQKATDRDAYVHRILLNTFTSSRRRRWTGEHPAAHPPEHPVPDETDRVDEADAVARALRRLPQDQRAAVVLRYYAHLTEKQMAEVLGVATGTIKSRLSRALTAMAQDPDVEELRETR